MDCCVTRSPFYRPKVNNAMQEDASNHRGGNQSVTELRRSPQPLLPPITMRVSASTFCSGEGWTPKQTAERQQPSQDGTAGRFISGITINAAIALRMQNYSTD